MASVIVAGDVSGSVSLTAPSAAGSTVITLPSTSGTMALSGGAGSFTTVEASGVATFSAGSASAPAITTSGDTNTGMFFPAADAVATATSGTERMRVDPNGHLFMGTTSQINGGFVNLQYDGLSKNGIVFKTTYSGNGSVYCYFLNSAGTNTGGIQQSGTTTVAYATSSDYRLKENVKPMVKALDKVSKLKPVTYNWKSDGSVGQGFIAHELQEIVPDCVIGEKDAVNEDGSIKSQSIDTSFLVATLTAAIQEQQALIENLTTRLSALENK